MRGGEWAVSFEDRENKAGRSISDGRRRREGGPLVMVRQQVGSRARTGPRSPGSPGRGSALCTTRMAMAFFRSSPPLRAAAATWPIRNHPARAASPRSSQQINLHHGPGLIKTLP